MTNDPWYYATLADLEGKTNLSESGIEIIIIQTIAKYMNGAINQKTLVEIVNALSKVNEALLPSTHYLIKDLALIKEETDAEIVNHLLTDALQKVTRV